MLYWRKAVPSSFDAWRHESREVWASAGGELGRALAMGSRPLAHRREMRTAGHPACGYVVRSLESYGKREIVQIIDMTAFCCRTAVEHP